MHIFIFLFDLIVSFWFLFFYFIFFTASIFSSSFCCFHSIFSFLFHFICLFLEGFSCFWFHCFVFLFDLNALYINLLLLLLFRLLYFSQIFSISFYVSLPSFPIWFNCVRYSPLSPFITYHFFPPIFSILLVFFHIFLLLTFFNIKKKNKKIYFHFNSSFSVSVLFSLLFPSFLPYFFIL